ncbi:radical SAM protein [Polyangium mundeleinium]|uniref:Radical SAM protein n=1 Tax=Polyangium mundeleinium TaxID=2995306 RepID=A0ABT5EH30_9BACT|nr:radical SAM protein [Polyangium mundeleinium]MDC0740799.1 radical SAM protein [Polyangium mundeleinium]
MAASEPQSPLPEGGDVRFLPPAPPWPGESLMVTFAFRCNIACTFCMVEDALNVLPGTSLEAFQRAVEDRSMLNGISRIIFSGGEVTLAKDLPAYAAFARSLPGIRHVRIQTNATRLGDRRALRTLMDAGIDEFFVSFHAPEAALYDKLVQREGSFESILAGLESIVAEGGALSTNTAIVAPNHDHLEAIVERLLPFRPQSVEFWNYWPRGDEEAQRQMAARVGDVRPHLIGALRLALQNGIPPVVKWFPRCLLGPFARYLDDAQPKALIDDAYWTREPAYSCIYEGICADAGSACSGLSHSYVEQHGWEETLLSPRRQEAGTSRPNEARVETRSLVKDAGEKRTHAAAVATWLSQFGLAPGMNLEGFRLHGAALGRGVAMLALQFEREGERIEVRLCPRDPRRPAFTRTASYDMIYARVPPALERAAQRLTESLARTIAAQDQGGRGLPG